LFDGDAEQESGREVEAHTVEYTMEDADAGAEPDSSDVRGDPKVQNHGVSQVVNGENLDSPGPEGADQVAAESDAQLHIIKQVRDEECEAHVVKNVADEAVRPACPAAPPPCPGAAANPLDGAALRQRIKELACVDPSVGFRAIHSKLKEEAEFAQVPLKKVQSLLREVKDELEVAGATCEMEGKLPPTADDRATMYVVEKANEKKVEGNAALAAGDFDVALNHYNAAQEVITQHCKSLASCGDRPKAALITTVAALRNNMALTLMKMAEWFEAEDSAEVAADFYTDAAAAADAVLALEPNNAKALMRKQKATEKARELGPMARRVRAARA
jgi:tetratricopeptide (TPR) repeat protein